MSDASPLRDAQGGPDASDAADATDATDAADASGRCTGGATSIQSCGGSSVDLCSDSQNCGACGAPCVDPGDGTRACVRGQCVDYTFVSWAHRDGGSFVLEEAGTRDTTTAILWASTMLPVLGWTEAQNACQSLGAGWRLPTRVEQLSIMRYGEADAALDPTYFPESSDPFAFSWAISHEGLNPYRISPVGGPVQLTTGLASGHCVKRVEGSPAARFDVTADTVYDRVTDLTWQRGAVQADGGAAQLAVDDAHLACIAWGGRLPTIVELASIIDERRVDASVSANADVFVDAPGAIYWSGTQDSPSNVATWYILSDGTHDYNGPNAQYSVRCVRAGR
jgi:hypothetical protein